MEIEIRFRKVNFNNIYNSDVNIPLHKELLYLYALLENMGCRKKYVKEQLDDNIEVSSYIIYEIHTDCKEKAVSSSEFGGWYYERESILTLKGRENLLDMNGVSDCF